LEGKKSGEREEVTGGEKRLVGDLKFITGKVAAELKKVLKSSRRLREGRTEGVLSIKSRPSIRIKKES